MSLACLDDDLSILRARTDRALAGDGADLVPIVEGLSDRGPGGNRPIDAGCLATGSVSSSDLGLSGVEPWTATIAFALAWRGLVWACSPLADRIATYLVREPPTLDAFRILQRSRIMLILGIVVAWILGGFLEELTFRAILLRSVESAMSALLPAAVAAGIAGGGRCGRCGRHPPLSRSAGRNYRDQLSMLFGLLFVLSGHDLWAVILCPGLDDTIAFIRFANKTSKYSRFEEAA